ncbi:U6 snRNA phosphodiesterase isoform X1 [Clupea harengus]|uniref:U6 snRNA phosphodiesterase n=2 Tax=Clupea harengus TaxID=7950 RepID=A0A6P3W3J8_CLUHA|nr:U6 snRNA phosphodiesterase isoform X1 [Clupea harengus]
MCGVIFCYQQGHRMLVSYSSSSEDESDCFIVQRKRSSNVTCHGEGSRFDKRTKVESVNSDDSNEQNKESLPEGEHGRLPVPDTVLHMFREEPWVDDSANHGGRCRSFQHERGNWATYVFLPYTPDEVFLELLDEMTALARSLDVPLTHAEEFHISLSQTVVLRHHWIQPFVQSLRSSMADSKGFFCLAQRLNVYSNSDKTRTFLGLEISIGHAQLVELTKVIDRTMEEFRLTTFYQNPSFHVSLGWCVGDQIAQLKSACLPQLQNLLDHHEEGPFRLGIHCHELRCKTGNKVFSILLQ